MNLMNTQGGLVVLCQVHSAVLAQTRFEWSAYISNIFLNIYIYIHPNTQLGDMYTDLYHSLGQKYTGGAVLG